jgi:tetratricopeptide (TPR) repeat protein
MLTRALFGKAGVTAKALMMVQLARLAFLIPLIIAGQQPLGAQESVLILPAKPLPIPFTQLPDAAPLSAPPELLPLMRRAAGREMSTRAKLQAILDVIFKSESNGGLGITYDNSHTRTVSEVLKDRKANCISLTALYVASCNLAGIPAHFAEPVNLNHWTRDGHIIRMERHVVALVSMFPQADLVADFLPQLRKRNGLYIVQTLSPERTLALFYSNRAVERLLQGHQDEAMAQADIAVNTDPFSSVSWNIHGVVAKNMGQLVAAEADYLKALSLDAKDTAAIGNMESLLLETNRQSEAMHYRQLGLELRKKDPYFQAFLAEEAIAAEQWAEAARLVATAIKLLPYESSFYLLKARLDLMDGKPQKAMDSLELARRWALPAERERYDSKIAMLKKS